MGITAAATGNDLPGARRSASTGYSLALRAGVPIAIGIVLALIPAPAGLAPNAWHYFALFVAVIVGIIAEPVPAAVVGMTGVAAAAALRLVRPGASEATAWALSGFGNSTVWLIFAAYMFALGYSKTGLGKRISLLLIRSMGTSTLGLGYAISIADLILAPFTASTTARSAGTIYPIIRNIPELYGSYPNDASARKIGSYLMYTAASVTLITSSMFITALAPNVLAVTLIAKTAHATVSWMDWFIGFAPVGFLLFLLLPYLLYKIYPPEIKRAPDAPRWATEELQRMGRISGKEITLLILVSGVLATWIGAAKYVDPAIAAIFVVVLMAVLQVVTWDDVIADAQAWNVLIWFATLVTLAGGLAEVKFIDWIARSITPMLSGLGTYAAILLLVGAFYFFHYFFAGITAHALTLYPIFLGVAVTLPGVSGKTWGLLLAYSLGLMGVVTPYGGGHLAIYYGSGFIKTKDFYVLGLILGLLFFALYLGIIVPWLAFLKF